MKMSVLRRCREKVTSQIHLGKHVEPRDATPGVTTTKPPARQVNRAGGVVQRLAGFDGLDVLERRRTARISFWALSAVSRFGHVAATSLVSGLKAIAKAMPWVGAPRMGTRLRSSAPEIVDRAVVAMRIRMAG